MGLSLANVPIFVLGTRGSLRNPSLADLSSSITYVDPVFINKTDPVGLMRIFLEFILNGRPLSIGERGCSLAHVSIRERIIDSGENWALVLEDDVGMPEDWKNQLEIRLKEVNIPDGSILLLNTNSLMNFSDEVVRLRVKPSGANAFLISRQSLLSRKYRKFEEFEISDWPISFLDQSFLQLSGLAQDFNLPTLVGLRPSSRIWFIFSTAIRFLFSPLFCLALKLPLADYLSWSVIQPIVRDLRIRFRPKSAFTPAESSSGSNE